MKKSEHICPMKGRGSIKATKLVAVDWRTLPRGGYSGDANVKSMKDNKGRCKGPHATLAGKERGQRSTKSWGSGSRFLQRDPKSAKFYGD